MLELQDISVVFHPDTIHEKKALSHVNLQIQKGDFVTIIGWKVNIVSNNKWSDSSGSGSYLFESSRYYKFKRIQTFTLHR